MNWVQLALAMVSVASQLLDWAKKRSALTEAQEIVAGQQAMKLLEMTKQGQELRERIAALDDAQSAELWERMTNGQ